MRLEATLPETIRDLPEAMVAPPLARRVLLIVVLPEPAPMDTAVAAPPMLRLIALVLAMLKVVLLVVRLLPFTPRSLAKVPAPALLTVNLATPLAEALMSGP